MLIPLGDVPRWYADRKPAETVAVRHGDATLTWGQFERNANRRAHAFRARGVKPGDFVAIGLPNSNVFYETTFAVWKCGATPTSLSPKLPRGEAAAILGILKPSLVVGGEADWGAPNTVPKDFEPEGQPDTPLDAPVSRYWKAMTSGGSTGQPKIILDHTPAVIDTDSETLRIAPGTQLLNPGPLYHNAPFILSHYALFGGGSVTGMQKFDASQALRLMAAHRIAWVNFVPTMMGRIWALPEAERAAADLSALKTVFHMAAPMPAWLKDEWIKWLGPERVYELYGGTERQGRTVISGTEWLDHRGSVGRSDNSAIRILDESLRDVPVGTDGEIFFLPPDGAGTSYHYIGAEPRRIDGGWESLGDIGRLDAEGYLYLGDRRSDMVLRGGANIYPAEVEAALVAHPDVKTSVVLGLPDADLGARLHAIIEVDPQTDADAVVAALPAFLGDRLSLYKHPESYEIAHESHRDDAGKVRRTMLRAERVKWLEEGREFRRRAVR